MDYQLASITRIREGLDDKEFKVTELVDQSLKVAEKHKSLNAFITIDIDKVKEKANWLTSHLTGGMASRLMGIPIAVKDMLLTEGIKTTAGSKMLNNFVPPYNGTVVRKLLEAGSLIIGKTNQDEFAMGSSNENSAFGPVLNPWDNTRVAGGSSGGSAVAVACGVCPISIGTDTGGSIRQPASFCGVVGLRPTYGRVSRYGVIAYASSLDQVGVFSRYVKDAAIGLEVIAGFDEKDATSSKRKVPEFSNNLKVDLKNLRIGIPKEYFIKGINTEVENKIKEALNLLEKEGAKLVEVSLPHTEYAIATYYIIAPAEASSNLGRYDGIRYGHRADANDLNALYINSRTEGFGSEVQRRILVGTYVLSKGYYDEYYRKALKVRTLIANDFQSAFRHCDVIASPVSPTTAFKLGEKTSNPVEMYLSDIFTIPANLAGLPAISVPCGFDSNNLPIGLQLIGNLWEEEKILQVAESYQSRSEWHLKTPLCKQ
jgi:aspartyl-tRNA(Asn)/glutamyl-tRNA(Gln) amidotransferase subunit A